MSSKFIAQLSKMVAAGHLAAIMLLVAAPALAANPDPTPDQYKSACKTNLDSDYSSICDRLPDSIPQIDDYCKNSTDELDVCLADAFDTVANDCEGEGDSPADVASCLAGQLGVVINQGGLSLRAAGLGGAVAANAPCNGNCVLDKPSFLGIPTISLDTGVTGIVDAVGFIAGLLSVVFIILGGIRYASASGNSQRIESAKQTIVYAVIGLIISIIAPLVVGFIIARGPQ